MTSEEQNRRIEVLVECAYRAVYDPSQWLELLKRFIALTGGDNGALRAPPIGVSQAFVFFTTFADEASADGKAFAQGRRAVLTERAVQLGLAPGVFVTSQIMSYDELHQTDYYRERLHPLNAEHALQSVYRLGEKDGSLPVALTIIRGRERHPFGDDEKAIASAVFPHIQRAISLVLDHEPARMINPGVEGALDGFDTACCLMGANGRVLFANLAARQLLGPASGLSLQDGRLVADDGTIDADLSAAIAKASGFHERWSERAASDVILRPPSSGSPVVAVVVPLGHENPFMNVGQTRAAVYLVDATTRALGGPELTRLRLLYGLTEAESAIANRLIEGKSVREIARARGTSEQTVRTQIKLIMEKTQSARQGDLMRLHRLVSAGPRPQAGAPTSKPSRRLKA